jgi:O-antigen/teichoic acid export membrane protein
MIQAGSEAGEPVPTAPIPVAERTRLIRDGVVNYSGLLVAGIVGIAVVPTMLDRLGAESYGLWVAVLAAVALIGEIDFGIGTIVTRELAAAPQSGDLRIARLVMTAGVAYLALGLIGGVLVGSVGAAIDGNTKLVGQSQTSLPFVFAMGGVLSFAGREMAFCISLLYGWRRFGRANAIIAATSVLAGAGTIAILIAGAGLEAVAAWQATVAGAAAFGALAIAASDWRRVAVGFPRPSWRIFRAYLPFGLASQLVTVCVNLLWLAAPVLTGSILGSRPVAAYDVGRKFPYMLSAIAWRSSEAFFPTASREGRWGTLPRRREVLDAVTRWNLVLVLPLSVVLLLLSPNLLAVWLETPPVHATVILQLLAATVLIDAFGAGALHVLWAEGRTPALLRILGITTIAGLGVMTALLWQAGVVGAAIAVLSATAARSLLLLLAAARAHEMSLLSLLSGTLLSLLIPLLACSSLTLALREFSEPDGWAGVVGIGVTAIAAYIVALSATGARTEERALLAAVTRSPWLGMTRFYRWLRGALRRMGPLRSAWYLARELAGMLGPGARPTASRLDRQFAGKTDPWCYGSESEQERYRAALGMLDAARAGRQFSNALEIGCAEGTFTELLVARCLKLKAVDISSVALARARARLGHCGAISFANWDVLNDAEPGTFDLVVVMDVLDYFKRPGDLRRVQERIRGMLPPGGHLLVTTTEQSDVFERARWRRWIRRGRVINESLALLPGVCVVESRLTAMHSVTLYVRADE